MRKYLLSLLLLLSAPALAETPLIELSEKKRGASGMVEAYISEGSTVGFRLSAEADPDTLRAELNGEDVSELFEGFEAGTRFILALPLKRGGNRLHFAVATDTSEQLHHYQIPIMLKTHRDLDVDIGVFSEVLPLPR